MARQYTFIEPHRPAPQSLAEQLGASLAAMVARPKVYPLYVTGRIQAALRQPDPEGIVADVGPVETLGDCRYAIPITDMNGTRYRITVQVDDAPVSDCIPEGRE
jgi:hypothetical protein